MHRELAGAESGLSVVRLPRLSPPRHQRLVPIDDKVCGLLRLERPVLDHARVLVRSVLIAFAGCFGAAHLVVRALGVPFA